MSNTYWDSYGRLHNKPCNNSMPSSNNGWIYTAYADKLMTIDLDRNGLTECFNKCLKNYYGYAGGRDDRSFLIRSPGKDLPPISRDEILGMVALGLLKPTHLNGWNFSPYPIPNFSLLKLIKQLWQIRPSYEPVIQYDNSVKNELVYKHRNYFWQNNLDQLYRFAFSVPLTDRNFVLQKWSKRSPIYWAIAKVDSMIGKPSAIRYLKYGKSLAAMQAEFPADHPLRGQ